MRTRSVVTAALILMGAHSLAAQQLDSRTWELRIPSGALIATGAQRNQVKDAQMTGVQLSRQIGSAFAVTGTFGWARSRDLSAIDAPKLDVFTSDVGIETCFEDFAKGPVSFHTFAGIGGGARSYNYRRLDVDATTNLAGYVAAGGEVGAGRVAVRVEARDYATGFKPLIGAGKSVARNDVMIMAALRFNRRSGDAR